MGRVFFQLLENVSDTLMVNQQALRFEVFRTATHITSGSSSTTLTVADRGGFNDGDQIYVGTNASVTISDGSLPATGAGTIVIGTAITVANNDTVALHTTSGAASARSVFYDDPLFSTAVSQPITPNSDNEVSGFLRSGRYAIRWYENTAGATLQLDHDVSPDEGDEIQVSLNHDSATAGIAEAIVKLAASAIGSPIAIAGGTVKLGSGTYSLTSTLTITQQNITIEGNGPSTVINVTSDSDGIFFDGSSDAGNGLSNVWIKNLRIRPATPNSNSLLRFDTCEYNWGAENVFIDAGAVTSTGNGLKCENCRGAGTFTNVNVIAQEGSSQIARGIEIDQDTAAIGGNITFFGGRVENCEVGCRIGSVSTARLPAVSFHGTKFLGGASVGSNGIEMGSFANSVSLHGCSVTRFTQGVQINGGETFAAYSCRFFSGTDGIEVSTSGSVGITAIGCEFDTLTNGVQILAGATQDIVLLGNRYTGVTTNVSNASTATSQNSIISHPDDDRIEVIANKIQSTGIVILGSANETEKTISGGAITITESYHIVDTESDASFDTLDTINGGTTTGAIVVISPANDARTILVSHGTGNIICQNDGGHYMAQATDMWIGMYNATQAKWMELSRTGSIDSLMSSFMGLKIKFPANAPYEHVLNSGGNIDIDVDPPLSSSSFLDLTSFTEPTSDFGLGFTNTLTEPQLFWFKIKLGNSGNLTLLNSANLRNQAGGDVQLNAAAQNVVLYQFSPTSGNLHELFTTPV